MAPEPNPEDRLVFLRILVPHNMSNDEIRMALVLMFRNDKVDRGSKIIGVTAIPFVG